ncbi:hypothetical protein OH76DRAFT_310443 [Lentinus brumalis]|uniref:Uncharacterized protein n=1 Tax=Lentinus brumalis TaxID=2498619 RepID=A0A371CKA0_9APHY|nr:hypothetical protein OH76DRAFT_310443 [Polyporus brumalis]
MKENDSGMPSEKCWWWSYGKYTTHPPFQPFISTKEFLDNLAGLVQNAAVLRTKVQMSAMLPALLHQLDPWFFAPLSFINERAADLLRGKDTPAFETWFALGDGGLHAVLETMDMLYATLRHGIPADILPMSKQTEILRKLHELTRSTLTVLTHFRAMVGREQWAPAGGFRDFLSVYQQSRSDLLREATLDDWLKSGLEDIAEDVEEREPEELKQAFTEAFGDSSDDALMTQPFATLGGEYGLAGFVERIVIPFLDNPPPSKYDSRYEKSFEVLATCLEALTHKLRKFGKKKSNANKRSNTDQKESAKAKKSKSTGKPTVRY